MATEGALAALAASKLGVRAKDRDYELEAAKAEAAVLGLGRVRPELDLDLRHDALPGRRDGGAHHRGPGLA